jgi:dTDP-4-amino-4,6-dideoxygalactose transaminase
MWVRKKLDISWADLLSGTTACLMPEPAKLRDPQMLYCQSARTAFDLLLQTLSFPPGTEILISAITIPDIVAIMRCHGLVPVPVDLEPTHLTPSIESLERGLRPATRMLVVAHLFGSHFDVAPFVAFAKQHDLILIEDRAQAFEGTEGCQAGEADLAFYSFGPIKTCTAMGGGLAVARDAGLLRGMQQVQNSYPPPSRFRYFKRIVKYGLMKAISARFPYALLNRICRCCRIDHDHLINRSARTFGERDLVNAIRRQPPAPLLRLLKRRLHRFDDRRLAQRAAKGRHLLQVLGESVFVPGSASVRHTHWLFPVVAREPEKLMGALREVGFDATQGESLCLVEAPEDRPWLSPDTSRQLLETMVFVPVYPEMPDGELSRMAAEIRRVQTDRRP